MATSSSDSSSKTEAAPHPMVPVPDAINIVLKVTAQTMKAKQTSNNYDDELPANAPPSQLLGRILAEDVVMRQPGYPPYRASIMDGYAIQSETYQPSRSLPVSGRVHAGSAAAADSSTDEPTAVYVTTGARIPDGYDCVVPIEQIEESPDKTNITIDPKTTISANKWIRGVGCDIEAGSVVCERGSCLRPLSLGLIQQSGQASVQLVKPIRVGILSTGNELLVSTDSWASSNTTQEEGLIETGQIPDVNKPILQGLLTSFGVQPIDLGLERDDDMESMAQTLQKALNTCDVILTTGGISMGETDIVEDVLVQRLGGTLHFGRLNMKPGKPTTFVTIQNCLVFALPGNPVSATVCTHLLVRPALTMLQQYNRHGVAETLSLEEMAQNTIVPPEITATLAHDIQLDRERPEYHRVVLESKPHGEYTATSTGVQRSSRLMSLRDAQGLLVLPQGQPDKPRALAGEPYTILLLEETTNPPVRLKDSQHLKPKKEPTKVAIAQITEDATTAVAHKDLSARVEKALSGSRSGSVQVVSCHDVVDWKDHFAAANNPKADLWVVVCSGSFLYCLQVSQFLRQQVVGKLADSLALQARRGAASQDGTAALFEPVVGYTGTNGCLLIALPSKGLEGGLGNVRGLLKHAFTVARGKPHNHHHHKHGH